MEDHSALIVTSDGTHVWPLPGESKTIFLVITNNASYFCKVKNDDLENTIHEITQDESALVQLAEKGNSFPHDKTKKIRGNEKDFSITLTYKTGLVGTKEDTHDFSATDLETFSGIMNSYQEKLSDNTSFKREELSPAKAILSPVITAIVIGGLTFFFASGDHSNYEATGRRKALKELFNNALLWLGPTGIYAVGGVIVLGCIIWAVTRFKNPPIFVTVKKAK